MWGVEAINRRILHQTSHILHWALALFLFVARILADHAHDILATHNLAGFALAFYGGSDFHFTVCGFGASLCRKVMRPFVRSYGDISTMTLSPGRMRMKCKRILPETCARMRCPFTSSTRNMVFGSSSTTFPSTSIASFSAMSRFPELRQ